MRITEVEPGFAEQWRKVLWRYGLSLGAVVIGIAGREALTPVVGKGVPFVTFYVAVAVVGITAGTSAGVVTTLLSALATAWFFLEPKYSFAIASNADVIRLVAFLVVGLIVSVLAGRISRKLERVSIAERETRKLAAIIEATSDFVGISQPEGSVIYINPAGRKLLGIPQDQPLETLRYSELCPDWAYKRAQEDWLPMTLREGTVSAEGALLTRAGKQIPVSFVMLAQKNRSGGPEFISIIARDISQQKLAQEALRSSEERLRLATEAAAMFAWECDVVKQTVKWSGNAAAVIGCRSEQLPEKMGDALFFVHPDDTQMLLDLFTQSVRGRRGEFLWEFRGPGEEAERRYWAAQGRIFFDESGVALRVLGVTQDITKRRRNERNLAFLAQVGRDFGRLTSAEELMGVVGAKIANYLGADSCSFMDVREEQRELSVTYEWRKQEAKRTAQTCPLSEYFTEGFLAAGRAKETVVVKDTQMDKRVNGPAYAALNLGSLIAVPFHKGGIWKCLLTIGCSRARDWSSDEIELFNDLANQLFPRVERARAEAALRESETRLRLSLEAARMATWTYEPATGVVAISENAGEMLEFAAGEVIPTAQAGLGRIHPEDIEAHRAQVSRALQEGGGYASEYRYVVGDRVVWLEERGQALRAGPDRRLLGIVMNVTKRKQAEEVLARGKEELEKLVAERTAQLRDLVGELEHFSYTITHDMRAPLRAMRAFAEALKEASDPRLGEEERMFVRRIITGAERMDALIADALSYSKAVRQELPLAPVSVGTLLQGMLDTYPEFQDQQATIRLERNIPVVMGNEAGLTQCFSNLIGNAVKFVPPGTKAQVRVWGEPKDGWVRLWVEDNGIGISKEMLPRIFDMFSRGAHPEAGTGIGLALVRKVVDRMGGRIGVDSEPGKGSRFWVDLRAGDFKNTATQTSALLAQAH